MKEEVSISHSFYLLKKGIMVLLKTSPLYAKFIWRINRATEFVCLSKAAGLDHDNDRF